MLIRALALIAVLVSGLFSVTAQAEGVFISVSHADEVWTPGYWVWNGHHRDYVEGHWDHEYRQEQYSQPIYSQEYYRQPYYTQQRYGRHHDRYYSRKCG